jgi:hypothetical protein
MTVLMLIFAIPPAIAAVILLVERTWKPIRRFLNWMRTVIQPAPGVETVTVPDLPQVAAPAPTPRRRPSFYDETVSDFDNKRNWDGHLSPLYPDAVATTGSFAQRQLVHYRNGTRTR